MVETYWEEMGHSCVECDPRWRNHPPGVTAQNCTRKGFLACGACVRELQASGYYYDLEEQWENDNITPMSKEALIDELAGLVAHRFMRIDAPDTERFEKLFRKAAKNRLQGKGK